MQHQYKPRATLACRACGNYFSVQAYRATSACYCSRACHAVGTRSHGESRPTATPEYCTWASMKQRCLNPAHPGYSDYGGRGIAVCPEWLDNFTAFLADVGRRPSPGHSIDRIDNDKGYEPGNVRWASRVQQAGNKRVSRQITFEGVERTVSEWAKRFGIHKSTLAKRLDSGWPVERALTTPAMY